MQTLLEQIDAFLERTRMSPTAFGARALNDPAFVPDLRDGRDCKMSTVEKVRAFMRDWRPEPADEEAAARKVAPASEQAA